MNILVVGASGGSGRAIVSELLAGQHRVTAFVRRADAMKACANLTIRVGDATDGESLKRAMQGHDAVVVTLGIRENALRVRLFGPRRTPMDIRSSGTRRVIDAMHATSVRRLIVQSTFGAGDTFSKLSTQWHILFALLLKPQIADTEEQERRVRASSLDWTIIRPVSLHDSEEYAAPFISAEGITRSMKVSRRAVARAIVQSLESNDSLRQCLSVSA